uniref:3'-5' exoribonuclease n=1 Tax=Clandestinovirus TaxID=2831644 RepID=A0A8F8KT23_9VIRU|nr:3'-5' exoribonuclease [Clandestinovirus]
MEWKPGRNPISIIQIASKNTVALFYIQKLGEIPDGLVNLLTNKNIIKVGCGMLEDGKRLYNEFGIEIDCDSWIDVQALAQQVDHLPLCGLKSLCEIYLGAYLDKRMAASNWSNRVLSPEQVIYAATDAWVVRHLLWSAFLKPTINGFKHDWSDCLSNKMAERISFIVKQTQKLFDSPINKTEMNIY